ncbi:YHS domain-containing (seleno)protein [Flavobacterium sp.]|uniref:YHS domain-containing (seleno)protein n=1 Tax=Flavobacterium sp. TaxID=239 RepID=UPI00286E7389|nr:YHS domain-containing (seleno)protein [Flavobacterium sp.]
MKKLVLVAFIALLSTTTFAQTAAKRISEYNLEKKVAIQGYDPVAYFTQKKAVKGKSTIASTYEGVIYYFATQADKDLFLKTPTQYEPQYGGWCSYAMGNNGPNGEKVEIDPETFKIVDGKLNLFYNAYFNNTLKSWNKDETKLKTKADINWKKIIK